jgi:2-polyprenyl-3-methyl-5-hydroxy-6-metoxy-1,4-benzoquinol methylase
MPVERVACDLCGAIDHRVKARIPSRLYLPWLLDSLSYVGWDPPQHWSIVQCKGCGLVFVNPRIRAEDMDCLYPPRLFWDLEKDIVRTKSAQRWRDQLALVCRYMPQGRLLDIGCANGFLVQAAQCEGIEAYGVEVSERAVRYARERLKLSHVIHGRLQDAGFPAAFFSAVTMFDVLEHIPSPREVLTEVVRVLAPGGVFIAQLPAVDSLGFRLFGPLWCYMQPASHLTYLSRDTVSRLLQEVGLEVVELTGPFAKIGVRSEIARKSRLLSYLWRWWRSAGRVPLHLRPNPFETICLGGTHDLMLVVGRKAL